jgi:hypothetical protein
MTPRRRPNDPEGPSLGLSPWNPSKGPEIPNSKLRTLLSKSSASLVIIGACDAITAVGKINAGPPIVAINSGPDRVTDVSRLARGPVFFYLSCLVGTSTRTDHRTPSVRADMARLAKAWKHRRRHSTLSRTGMSWSTGMAR